MNIDLHLHAAQMRIFQCPARYVVVAAGRRFGKTSSARAAIICNALDPANVRKLPVFIIAPTQAQAKVLYWQPLLDAFGPLVKNMNVNEGLMWLQNGVLIGVKGSDRPDTLRGLGLYYCVIDEYADIKPEVWESIIRPQLSDVKGRALFIGSPKGRNHFYDLYNRGVSQDPDDVDYESFHFTSLDNPFLDRKEIEDARRDMSSATFRREYLASFEFGSSETFKEEWFKYSDDKPKRQVKGGKPDQMETIPGDWFVAVDLGSLKGIEQAEGYRQKRLDQTAIAVVWVDEEKNWWVRDVYLGRWTAEETARRIVDAVESCKTTHLGIEKGALYDMVAPKVVSEAASRKLTVRPMALSHENQSKTDRIAWALQGPMEHGRVYFRKAGWNKDIEDQFLNFPSTMVHDDGIEAIAYVEQMAKNTLFDVFGEIDDEPYWEADDKVAGY